MASGLGAAPPGRSTERHQREKERARGHWRRALSVAMEFSDPKAVRLREEITTGVGDTTGS
ncbi:hypothetical protein HNR06_005355 [Nocardiopsis arvandica]|uniref:Uncharacterized protein n=1 Tax=Nocardiopsis sinuspersici TaxID=501010 RepID=A0A7Y9XH70_9ACTN|nr:hypothetical protein [Nocardiopsis sinuspersici]NYH55766.1 hypothetical protein [Nocardiopsis sinuspersici]